MAKDRREDAGQFYAGGSVIPRGPVKQGGGGVPSDYAAVSENASVGAVHAGKGGNPHGTKFDELEGKPNIPKTLAELSEDATHRTVKDEQKAAWDAKQDSLTAQQLENIAAVPDKRDKSDLDVYEVIRTENTDWTLSFSPSVKELEDAYKGKKPTFVYGNVWVIERIEVGAFTPNSSTANAGRDAIALEGFNFIDTISGDLINLTITRPRYMDENLGPAKANEKLASRDTTAAQGALAKFGLGGKLVAATSQDVPELAAKRDKTDNICALDEYTEWVFSGIQEGDTSTYTVSFVEDPQMWAIKRDGVVIFWKMDANEDDVEIRGPYEDADYEKVISPLMATRHIVAKANESYVTPAGVENLKAGGLTPEAMTVVFATPAFAESVKADAPEGSLGKEIYDLKQGGGGGVDSHYQTKPAVALPDETVDGVVYSCFQLADQTVNVILLETSKPARLYFPQPSTGNNIRDFLVKVKVTSEDIPSVTFVKNAADTSIGFEYADESWADLEAGINLFSFTETEKS